MKKRILIVTDDSGESFEILYATQRFIEAGWKAAVAASVKKRLHAVIHDFEPGWNTYVEKPGYGIQADLDFSKVKVADYEAVLLVGGRAPEFLRNDEKLLKIVREFHARGKWIFSICHGIQILVAAGLAGGRKLTCYRHVRLEVDQAGGEWIDQPCVTDGRIISGQTWESHPEFYREVFKRLDGG